MHHLFAPTPFLPIVLVVFLGTTRESYATPSESQALLSNGDNAGARSLVEKEYRENPSDPTIALLYAKSVQDGVKALELFKKISTDSLFPDSIRSHAYVRCAWAAYVKERFQKAEGYLKKASRLSPDQPVAAARYLAGIHDTADTIFLNSLKRQAEDTSSYDGKDANYFLGLFYFSKKDYAAALGRFNASFGASDSLWWKCASFAGAYFSAVSLSRSEEAASILSHLKRVYPEYLEKALVAKAKPAIIVSRDTIGLRTTDTMAVQKASHTPLVRPVEHRSIFSLQVGAFGSADNAGLLKADLGKRYSPVSVMAVLVQDKPLYRVRVGVFATKESAQAFGDTALTKKGLKFRVVEDVPVE